jgi:transcriptional regulator with XRE-family HTH domain
MVRSRGESPATGDANLLPASVPDIGRSLQLAREQADLTLAGAAQRCGLRSAALEALESGSVGLQHDRIETLRTMRTYANSLGLPGDEYVLMAVDQWPAGGSTPIPHSDTALVPVVSISSAPAGGHSPVGGGAVWPSDATGVADATTTGVFEPIARPLPLSDSGSFYDTGQLSIVDTGEVPAVKIPAPRILKVLVGVVTFLILVGGAALIEHDHVDGWAHDVRSSTAHWYDNGKVALGITAKPKGHTSATSPPEEDRTQDHHGQGRNGPLRSVCHPQRLRSFVHRQDHGRQSSLLGTSDRRRQSSSGVRAGPPRQPDPALYRHKFHDDPNGQRVGSGLHL